MSYEITHTLVAELSELSLPYNPNLYRKGGGLLELPLGESALRGELEGDRVKVTVVDIYGSGSRGCLTTLKTLLTMSTGRLDLIIIWEGGDSISRLRSVDGSVTEEPIDLVKVLTKGDKR